jgi:hypothetical protein
MDGRKMKRMAVADLASSCRQSSCRFSGGSAQVYGLSGQPLIDVDER